MNSVTSINKLDFSHKPALRGAHSASFDQSSDESDQEEGLMPVEEREETEESSKPLCDPELSQTVNLSISTDLEPHDFDLGTNWDESQCDGGKPPTPTNESKL